MYFFSFQTLLNKLIMVSMNLTLPPSSNELNCCINNVESFYFMHGQFHIDFPLQDCYYTTKTFALPPFSLKIYVSWVFTSLVKARTWILIAWFISTSVLEVILAEFSLAFDSYAKNNGEVVGTMTHERVCLIGALIYVLIQIHALLFLQSWQLQM